VLASSAIPRGYLLLGREPVEIGRGKESTLPIFHDSISRRHARITRDGYRYVIEDLGSTNGTTVQGKPVKGPTKLDHDDVISVGSVELRFLVVEASREELAARFNPQTEETNKVDSFAVAKSNALMSGRFTRQVLHQV